jgi:hypothetical protein
MGPSEVLMSACSFEYLLQLISKQLDLDKQIEVYDHLDRCDICRDAVHQISHDLDGKSFIYGKHCVNSAIRCKIDASNLGAHR